MAIQIPTTAALLLRNLSNLEGKLNQSSPLADKAFLRVLAAMEAGNHTELYKFTVERALQCLALTATGADLNVIGINYGVIPKPAEATVLTIELPGTNGAIIEATNNFVGDSNGIRYSVDAAAIVAAGVAVISVTSRTIGTTGNLNVGDTLTIETQVAGAESIAEVTIVDNLGVEPETDDAYRLRVLDAIQTGGGGGNAADYRAWSQEVGGVFRAYPFSSGPPLSTPKPPDRIVYVEADSTVDPDGIAPQSLLDEVRVSITTDPETGLTRQPLGLTDGTLFIESIARLSFYVEIRGLTISAELETAVKEEIEVSLTIYFRAIRPYVDGLDPVVDRQDLITDLTISNVVQDVLAANGGSALGVGFGFAPSTFVSSYRLAQGETSKLASGGVSYA